MGPRPRKRDGIGRRTTFIAFKASSMMTFGDLLYPFSDLSDSRAEDGGGISLFIDIYDTANGTISISILSFYHPNRVFSGVLLLSSYLRVETCKRRNMGPEREGRQFSGPGILFCFTQPWYHAEISAEIRRVSRLPAFWLCHLGSEENGGTGTFAYPR